MSKLIGIDGSPIKGDKVESPELAAIKKTAEEKKSEVNKLIEKAYSDAREKFRTDESYFKDYADFAPEGKYVLVKLFKFSVPEEFVKDAELGRTALYVQSPLDKSWKIKESSYYDKIYPIVKVISVGDQITGTERNDGKGEPKYKSGDLAAVQGNEIEGLVWNPDWLHVLNTFGKQGNGGRPALAHVPDDMQQKIPALDINWERYRFTNLAKPTDEGDKLVYLIPDAKLRGHLKK